VSGCVSLVLSYKLDKKMNKSKSITSDYRAVVSILKSRYTQKQWNEVMNQFYCEYDGDFMGFIDIYEPLSQAIPTSMRIIDFGCYCAFQAALFKDHKEYIGVDKRDLKRFSIVNTTHYVESIQDFIAIHPETISDEYFTICSYVPDADAVELVRKSYVNCFTYYPSTI